MSQLFTVHIMGYSLADTALVALISRYASPETQGRSMGLNQAAQSLSRVISPVVSRIGGGIADAFSSKGHAAASWVVTKEVVNGSCINFWLKNSLALSPFRCKLHLSSKIRGDVIEMIRSTLIGTR